MPNPIHHQSPQTKILARACCANLPSLKVRARRRPAVLVLAVKMLALLIVVLAIPLAPPAGAASLVVDTLADENDGSCSDGDCSLRDAIAVAAPGDEITFSVTGAIVLTGGELVIDKDPTVTGPGAGNLALDGNNAGRIFNITGGNVTISKLTMQNGRSAGANGGAGTPGASNGAGGAIYIAPAATVSLSDITFDRNTAIGGSGGNAVEGSGGGGGGVGGAGASYGGAPGAPGGDGGGGGGGSFGGDGGGGGDGGFGGGGGGGGRGFYAQPGGNGGTGGGNGGASGSYNGYGGGGGGAGMGGAIFNEGVAAIKSISFTNNTAQGGNGGNGFAGGGGGGGGAGLGSAIFNKGSLCLQPGNTFSANDTAGGSGGSPDSSLPWYYQGSPGSAGSGLDTETGIYYDDSSNRSCSVTTAEETSYTFSAANFPFNDADGHTFAGIRIVTVETAGDLAAGGVDVTANQMVADVTSLVFSPAADENGSPYATFTFQVRDSSGAFSAATYTMTIHVTPVNDDPTGGNGSVTINEDTSYTFSAADFTFDDVDGHTFAGIRIVTVETAGDLEAGGVAVTANQVVADVTGLVFSPAADANGSPYASFTFQVRDSSGAFSVATYTMTIHVTPVNDAPVIAKGATTTVTMDEDGSPTPFNLTLHASDADGDTLTWSIQTPAGHGTASASGTGTSMVIGYTPQANYNGLDSFVVQVDDGNGGLDTITVSVNINPQNDPPTANDDSYTVDEDSTSPLPVLANDTFAPDTGETLTVIAVGPGSAGGTIGIGGGGSNITYTPALNFFGTETFTYTINDGTPGSNDTATVTVTINSVNDAPTVANAIPNQNTAEDTLFSFTFAANTFNDVDPGDSLTYAASLADGSPLPAWLSFDPASRTFSGTPSNADVGAISIRVTATDTASASVSDTFDLTVANTNDAPLLDPSGAPYLDVIDEDTVINLGTPVTTLISRLGGSGITDVDAGALTGIAIIGLDNANGAWEYTTDDGATWNLLGSPTPNAARLLTAESSTRVRFVPNPNYNGTIAPALTFRAWDVTSGSNGDTADTTLNGGTTAFSVATETASTTVTPVNDLPTANDDAYPVDEDSTSPLPVLANDTFAPDTGETLTVIAVGPGSAGGTIGIGGGGSNITYTPALNFFGTETFTYTINDGTPGSNDTATVTVTINSVNDAPVIAEGDSITVTMDEDGSPTPFSLTLNASDIEDDTLAWSIQTPAGHGTASASGTGTSMVIGYTPQANYNGLDSFVVQVDDGNGGLDTITVNVVINPQSDDPPVIAEGNSISVTMDEDGSPTPFNLTLHASDADGDTLTWSIQTPAGHGTASASGTGTSMVIGYTPQANYNGPDSFVVQVDDGNGHVAAITVNVAITARAEAPLFLPLIVKAFDSAPNLIVESITASRSNVTLVIRNAGNAPVVDAFWVDVYFNPSQTPGLNQPWQSIAGAGAAWGVTRPLQPGESLTLTTGGDYYDPGESSPAPFPVGVPVYALVDSINYKTSYGNVQESSEADNLFGPVTSTQGQAAATSRQGQAPALDRLPRR